MKTWYQSSSEEVVRGTGSSRAGLTEAEVEKRLGEYGDNTLQESGRKKAWQVFLEQFQDLLVVILIVAAVISMLSDNVESTIVIFAVIIMNAILGTVQHEKAEKSLDSLKQLSAPVARLIRDGKQLEVPSAQIVPGDVVMLEAGDVAAADGRVLESYHLQINESSLTGESESVEKQVDALTGTEEIPLAEQTNMVFSGSLVTGGRGLMVVTATGMETEIGKIASLMNATGTKKTPLQISLDQFSGKLAAVIMVICAMVFALSLYRRMPVLDSLMFAVALAVAAIPEALGSIVTIVQAMGTQRMAKEHAIIKDLKAVESLGCVSVICSDKTGTLTQNRMTVQAVFVDGAELMPAQLNPYHQVHRYLLYDAVLNNDASGLMGDPTEQALLALGEQAGIHIEEEQQRMPRLGEIPFDSDRKLMSTIHQVDGSFLLFTKGAMDVLLERSSHILTEDGLKPLTGAWKQRLQEQNRAWSEQGLRVLAMAYKELDQQPDMRACGLEMEQDYMFLGMTAMQDPPRIESRPAVASAKRAGIRTIMITGDHRITAEAIARKIGIFEEGDMAVTGLELDHMSEDQLQQNLETISVYARVSPEHKIRIVDAWQSRGNIVAMTGDGVNDAPALKKADIGVAMGITGTEVSKDAAAMILTDDNFATIIKAVSNGRNVYRNIRHAIQFLLSGNMAGIFSVLYTSLLALPMPFAPVHLLFINLLTDSLPAIAIGMEPQEEGLLEQPPRDPKEGILTGPFLGRIMVQGGLIAIATMLAYHAGLATGGAGTASTMAFAALTLARLFHGFNCRSDHSIMRIGFGSNLWSVMAFEAGVVLLAAVLFLPGLQVLFAVADLSLQQVLTVVALAFLPTVVIQIFKTIKEALG
ncbi:MAG: cation-translocating P-type ATPase [Lachnospiraceae bacterium]|nr:cation-translocating P-type ATPase [Lachnospiraceae bacterium]